MASEAIRFIRTEEEKTTAILQEAQVQRAEILAQAQKDADACKVELLKQAEETADRLRAEYESETRQLCEEAHAKREQQLNDLRAQSDGRYQTAVEAVLKEITAG